VKVNNINTRSYWDNRFVNGDWEAKSGRDQTREFAVSQIKYLDISRDFTGVILDFGCGLGDAFPIYKKAYPKAKLIGLDISEEAILKCNEYYGHLADFICGTHKDVPKVDIIIASNVFEHLSDDKEIAKDLLRKCNQLNIIVPYNEIDHNNPMHEHVNFYTEFYFDDLSNPIIYKIFISKGWGQAGIYAYYNIYFKNIVRVLLGRKKLERPKQIIFKFYNLR
jgi:2-polyprenyl-3-methyl-5-hydroxy-6-metoxy-1,4-benzoquinol methylase